MHSNWRDCDAWRAENLGMNTSSNEACKYFDMALSQLLRYKDDTDEGGLVKTMEKMTAADPNFILGQCLNYGVTYMGNDILLNSPQTHENVRKLVETANSISNALSKREMAHVNAIAYLHSGDIQKSVDTWDSILAEYPNDILALKFSYSLNFYLGNGVELRDFIARALPLWNPSDKYYGLLHGMYAFGLAHNNELDKAEKIALQALDMSNKVDAWATHSMSHVNEYGMTYDKGIKFLLDTESNWSSCNFLSNHNYWHMCLFHLEKQEYEPIVSLIERVYFEPKSNFDMIDLSSLLLRMKIDNYKDTEYILNKFKILKDYNAERVDKHGYLLSDAHKAIVFSMCGTEEEKEKFLSSLREFVQEDKDNLKLAEFIKKLNADVGIPLLNGVIHFGRAEYDQAVQCIYPVRDQLKKIGGSRAQVDVFQLVLLVSALNSSDAENKKIGLRLLSERLADKTGSQLTKRIALRYSASEDF